MSNDSSRSKGKSAANLRALADAMAHPVRAKLLFAITEAGDQGASIRQVALRTGEPKRRVRYHLDSMLKSNLLGIASEQRKGGVVERYFRAEQLPWIQQDPLLQLDGEQKRQISIEIFKALFADVTAAARDKHLGEGRVNILARTPGQLDERGWRCPQLQPPRNARGLFPVEGTFENIGRGAGLRDHRPSTVRGSALAVLSLIWAVAYLRFFTLHGGQCSG